MARRKEQRKQGYQALPNCFDRQSFQANSWAEVFQNNHPITFELGCGKADLSLTLARKYPDRNYVGIDLKTDRMWHAAQQAQAEGLSNMAFLWIHLLEITDYVQPHEAAELWITFPDPYPKAKQAKHRMINPNFLQKYRQILTPNGRVNYKTDNRELFLYSLEVFVKEQDIHFHTLSFDLHEAEALPVDLKITTAYERAFMELGTPINYVSFSFRANTSPTPIIAPHQGKTH